MYKRSTAGWVPIALLCIALSALLFGTSTIAQPTTLTARSAGEGVSKRHWWWPFGGVHISGIDGSGGQGSVDVGSDGSTDIEGSLGGGQSSMKTKRHFWGHPFNHGPVHVSGNVGGGQGSVDVGSDGTTDVQGSLDKRDDSAEVTDEDYLNEYDDYYDEDDAGDFEDEDDVDSSLQRRQEPSGTRRQRPQAGPGQQQGRPYSGAGRQNQQHKAAANENPNTNNQDSIHTAAAVHPVPTAVGPAGSKVTAAGGPGSKDPQSIHTAQAEQPQSIHTAQAEQPQSIHTAQAQQPQQSSQAKRALPSPEEPLDAFHAIDDVDSLEQDARSLRRRQSVADECSRQVSDPAVRSLRRRQAPPQAPQYATGRVGQAGGNAGASPAPGKSPAGNSASGPKEHPINGGGSDRKKSGSSEGYHAVNEGAANHYAGREGGGRVGESGI